MYCSDQNTAALQSLLPDCRTLSLLPCSRKWLNGTRCGCPRLLITRQTSTCQSFTIQPTNVVGVLPLEPHLQVMVLVHQFQEPVEERLAFMLCQSVDVLDMSPNRKDALPPRHWVRSYHWVNRLEFLSHVLRRSSFLVVQLKSSLFGHVVERRLCKCGTQSF